MLEKLAAFIGILMLLIFFVAGGTVVIGGTMKLFQLQSQTQILANMMSRSGYYNDVCEESLTSFCDRSHISRNDLEVETVPTDTGDMSFYGDTVKVRINYPFRLRLSVAGMEELFNFDMKTEAGATSTFMSGINLVP